MKQYTIEEAYTGNVGIRCFEDGKEMDFDETSVLLTKKR